MYESDLSSELLLAAQVAVRDLSVLLASDNDDDADDDSSGGEHSSHGTYKALVKKGVKPVLAAKMCARADSRVKAVALAGSAEVILAGLSEPEDQDAGQPPTAVDRLAALAAPPGESASERRSLAAKGWALPDGSYPIPDKKHLHSAAVLAASKHGNWQAAQRLIRKRARDLGVDVSTLPGFGKPDSDGEKAAASMLALAAKVTDGGVAMEHGPFTGTHTHSHSMSAAHDHPHQHAGDSTHDGGPLHRAGSQPRRY